MKKILSLFLTTLSLPLISNLTVNKVSALDNKEFQKPKTLEELRAADINDLALLKQYDSRDYDIVTPVKNQQAFGRDTCWAYASMAASETSILREGLFYSELRNLDLSELSHSYVTFNNDPSKDPLGLTEGDNYRETYNKGYSLDGSGKKMLMWASPSHEDYIENDANPKVNETAFYLEDIIKVDHNDISDMKKAIARYGAITVVYKLTDWHEDYYYYNSNINVFDGDIHAVTIVGWDDTVDRNKYKMPSKLDGGWIVKNSWGTSHKEGDGYFMMSYDSPITDTYAFDFASKDKYDFNYHYDSSTTKDDYLESNESTSVIFPAKKGSINKKEILKAINVSITDIKSPKKPGEGLITAEIYKNVEANSADIYSSINNPKSGKLVSTVSRKINHEGSYTLELNEEIELEKGSYFSVVVKVSSPDDKYRVSLANEKYTSMNDMTFYEKEEGKWINCGNPQNRMAARIKAFTKLLDRTEEIGNDIRYSELSIKDNQKYRYGNMPEFIEVNVISDGQILEKDTDYRLEPVEVKLNENLVETTSDNDIVGTAIIKVKGIGSWIGENTISIPILVGKFDLSYIGELLPSGEVLITTDVNSNYYSDIILPTDWKFVFPEQELKIGENTGNYVQYCGVDEKYYRKTMFNVIVKKTSEIIEKINIQNSKVEILGDNFIFNGKPHTPKITLTLDNQILKLNRDYILKYENNINVGEAKIIITGIGNYEGEIVKTFKIKKPSISNSTVKFELNHTYTGKEITPEVVVTLNGKTLILNEDYSIKYENNINVGEARIIITGIGNYEGEINKVYTIIKAKNQFNNFEIIDGKPQAESNYGEIIYKYYSDKDCLNEIEKPTLPGEYFVKAIVMETSNYDGIESEVLRYVIDEVEEPSVPSIPDNNNENVESDYLTSKDITIITIVSIIGTISIIVVVILIIKKLRK